LEIVRLNVWSIKRLHVGSYFKTLLNVKLRSVKMTYEELKDLVGEDNAVRVYDYFVDFTVDNLVQLVLDGFTPSQLLNLVKELNDD
jgi:hypothetical protein